jgi:DNA-binding HxlR family transcriptional regulator
MRAGTSALSLLARPLNVIVLQNLAEGPRPLVDLRCEAGSPPKTTMRQHLRILSETGVIVKRREDGFASQVDYELGEAGRDLLKVAEITQGWLSTAPGGSISLGSAAAKSAVKALIDGWSANVLRALAATPLSLTELDSLISALSYPSLERRLTAMREAGQIVPLSVRGKGTPYAATTWLRQAVGPLAAAIQWERRFVAADTATIAPADAETAFLLAVPLARLSEDLSGLCRFTVELPGRDGPRTAGIVAGMEGGRVTSCTSRLQGDAEAWASGSARAWLSALVDEDVEALEVGGDCRLAVALLDGLHHQLFRMQIRI